MKTFINKSFLFGSLFLPALVFGIDQSNHNKGLPHHQGTVELHRLSYFPPDERTAEFLSKIKGNGEALLRSEISRMSSDLGVDSIKINLKVVNEIQGGHLAQVVPDFSSGAYQINLFMTKEGIKNPAVIMEELIHLQQITNARTPWNTSKKLFNFTHPYQWAEVVANAQAGSLQAAEALARLELEATIASKEALAYFQSKGVLTVEENMRSYLEARTAHAEKIHTEVAARARTDLDTRRAKQERSRKILDQLNADQATLNKLVANNDRKGVRRLVDKHLPWDLMEPSEKKAWQTWLEAIESPDKKNSKLVFRGMGNDLVRKTENGGVYLTSGALGKSGTQAPEGLRSLENIGDSFGRQRLISDGMVSYAGEVTNPTSVTAMMSNHVARPERSPFLSFSSLNEASKSSKGKYGAFLIDERRLLSNVVSGFPNELERMAPLFIFPDEVVANQNFANGLGNERNKEEFAKMVEEKLERPLTTAERRGPPMSEFRQQGLQQLRELSLEGKRLTVIGQGCGVDKRGCDCVLGALNSLLK
jgi:hypothetical protein